MNLSGFQLKPFSTIDGNMDEVKRRLTDGVKQRTRKRRSSGEGVGMMARMERG